MICTLCNNMVEIVTKVWPYVDPWELRQRCYVFTSLLKNALFKVCDVQKQSGANGTKSQYNFEISGHFFFPFTLFIYLQLEPNTNVLKYFVLDLILFAILQAYSLHFCIWRLPQKHLEPPFEFGKSLWNWISVVSYYPFSPGSR